MPRKQAVRKSARRAAASPARTEPAVLGAGKHLRLVKLPSGYEFAERTQVSGIVVIVAVSDERKLVLIEHYRPPVDRRVIELPAGLAGDIPGSEHELLATAAARELEEETGYRGGEFEWLCEGPPSPGMSSEVLTFFRATGLKKVADGGGDASENITVHEVPLDDVPAWLAARAKEGLLVHPNVYVGLYFLSAPQPASSTPRRRAARRGASRTE